MGQTIINTWNVRVAGWDGRGFRREEQSEGFFEKYNVLNFLYGSLLVQNRRLEEQRWTQTTSFKKLQIIDNHWGIFLFTQQLIINDGILNIKMFKWVFLHAKSTTDHYKFSHYSGTNIYLWHIFFFLIKAYFTESKKRKINPTGEMSWNFWLTV